jgi:hypothetical protein
VGFEERGKKRAIRPRRQKGEKTAKPDDLPVPASQFIHRIVIRRLAIEDLPSSRVAPLRAAGLINPSTTSAAIDFVDVSGVVVDAVVLRLYHRMFPNGGNWSRFVNPCCGRTSRILRLHNGEPTCVRCLVDRGIRPRSQTQSPYQRALGSVARLTKLLNEPPTRRAHLWGTVEKRSRREAELVEAQLRVAMYQRRARKKLAKELEPPPEPDRIKRPNRRAVHPATTARTRSSD